MLQKSCKRTDKLLVDPVLSPCPIYELTHCASSGKRMLSSTDNRRLEPFSKETFSFVYLYNYCTSMLPDGNHQGPNIALRRRVAKAEEFKPRPVFRSSLHWQTLSLWYCGWKKSCTSWYMFFFQGFNHPFGGAGFLPSTVWLEADERCRPVRMQDCLFVSRACPFSNYSILFILYSEKNGK